MQRLKLFKELASRLTAETSLVDVMLDEIAALREQLAAAQKDAERLRAVFHRHRKNCHFYGICQPSFKEWIAAIDAAMKEKAE